MRRLRDFWRGRSGLQKVGLVTGAVIVVGYVGAVIADNATMDGSGSEASRCVPVPTVVLSAIEEGLTVSGGGGSLRNGYAVESDDYEQVYFVAAEIDGPGMTGDGEVGLWATNRIDDLGGLIFAVDSLAEEFTDWGPGDTSDAEMTTDRDGAKEAVDCAS